MPLPPANAAKTASAFGSIWADIETYSAVFGGFPSFCTTLPPYCSKTRWKPAALDRDRRAEVIGDDV